MEVSSLKQIFEVFKTAAREYGSDGAGRSAAALAFYTLFSLVPMLFLVVAIGGFILGDVDRLNALVEQVETAAGETVAEQIGELFEVATEQAGTSLGIGLVLTVFSASGIFLQVQGVLNRIFKVETERVRGWMGILWKRGVAFVSALVLALLTLAPVLAVAGVRYVNQHLISAGWLRSLLGFGVPILSVLLLMSVVGLTFQTMTAELIPWRAAIRGGAATALVGLVAAYLVGWFLGTFGVSGTLGVLGGVAILLFFFNLMWQVYLFGAEVTKVYAGFVDDPRPAASSPSQPASTTSPQAGMAGIFGLALGFLLGRRRR